MATRPTLRHERALRRRGWRLIAGLDEVGRGAWAGPVVAAAVILPDLSLAVLRGRLPGLDDSKRLSAPQRQALEPLILEMALAVGLGGAGAGEIDRHGIVAATREAMRRALAALATPPAALLIDALRLPEVDLPQRVLFHADALCLSVAAASVVAKCARDRHMAGLEEVFPGYDFARHKGYGTRAHHEALGRLGPCEVHRLSFAPVKSSKA